ncbi:efflux transporter outer membrane subunit [Acidithiobacillus sp. IBUN Pt1247-S3]|uniref:efflux transporter outer membrane subunit n=1 Tax=Acidithiobacillus sp. IBUN Pt1247-S3 TaxID=3166642 RepID=UPI0034E55C39
MPVFRPVFFALCAFSLAGCAVGPHLPTPPVSTPTRYTAQSIAHGAQAVRWTRQEQKDWWNLLHSPLLDHYIAEARKANPDLQAAQASLAREQALVGVAEGGLMPQVDAGAGVSRERALRTGANGGSAYRIPGNPYSLLLGTLSISYAPDLFGRQADQIHAAKARAAIAEAQWEQAQVFLAAAVSQVVISGAEANAQWQAARQIAGADTRLLQLLEQEYHLGATNLQTVEQQKAIAAAAKARIAPLAAQRSAAQHALAALLGRNPDSALPLPRLRDLQLPNPLPTTLPSALLEQRPDIVAARAALDAAAAEAKLAAADRYPQISLSASIGKAAQSGALFFNPMSTLWSLGASLAAPIYHGGALAAQEKAAVDQYQVRSAQYRGTVLTAFRQVADALRTLQATDSAYTQQVTAQTAAKAALQLAQARYRDGDTAYQTVLNAEIAYQQDTVAAIQGRSQRYLDSVGLFLALGDGWTPAATPAQPAHSGAQS